MNAQAETVKHTPLSERVAAVWATDKFRGVMMPGAGGYTAFEIGKSIQIEAQVHADLLAALKECALEIAQIHNRKLTSSEQCALATARAAIAKAGGAL